MRLIDAHALSKVYMMKGKDKLRISAVINELELSPTIYMPRRRWIPCDKRLPQDDAMMLVTCRTKRGVLSVNRAYYSNGCWHGSGSMAGVIAWMELPEPYDPDDVERVEAENE